MRGLFFFLPDSDGQILKRFKQKNHQSNLYFRKVTLAASGRGRGILPHKCKRDILRQYVKNYDKLYDKCCH